MDEMRSFYHDKKHQIRLWWAIDHHGGEVVAFRFGTREPAILLLATSGTSDNK
jgi:IS1 family transposase